MEGASWVCDGRQMVEQQGRGHCRQMGARATQKEEGRRDPGLWFGFATIVAAVLYAFAWFQHDLWKKDAETASCARAFLLPRIV